MSLQQADTRVRNIVVEHWLAALEYDDPEPGDDWFEFGGDSLGAFQMLGRLEREGLVADIAEFFRSSSLESLVRLVGEAQRDDEDAAPATSEGVDRESLPLTPTQLFTVVADGSTRNWHNDHLTIELCEHATWERLRHAVQTLAAMHPALTAQFTVTEDGWRQRVSPAGKRVIPLVGVPVRGPEDIDPVNAAVLERGSRFDISRGEVSVALVWEEKGKPIRLTLLFHHLCADGHSADVLQRDIVAAVHGQAATAPLEDNYVPWLARLADRRVGQRTVMTEMTLEEGTGFAMSGLRRMTLSLEIGELTSREIAPALLTAMSRAVADSSDPRARRVDVTWHGRDPIQGWPSLATTVGWFSQLRRLELPSQAAWDISDCVHGLESFARDNESAITGDSATALLSEPAALYLNYRGSLIGALDAPVHDCLPVDIDFGPQSSPEATTPYHLRCVADRIDGSIRLGIKYRPGSAIAARVIGSLRGGLTR
ncbi:phosphopantetheine-binding protein [Streptomyces sp. NPDC102364]|uniref:phosphopantetheine-binding protein n=1 Tax=Streptomyces sp. NPDC102364 TaxID=3366161 RepID=UPI003805B802